MLREVYEDMHDFERRKSTYDENEFETMNNSVLNDKGN